METRELDHFKDPPAPRVSVEYLESVEPVIEESVREVSTRNEYDRDIFFGALSEPNPTTAQPDSAQPDETVSTTIVCRPIRVAQNWADKVPKHSTQNFDKRLTVNMHFTHHSTPPIEYFDNYFPHDLVELLVEQTNIYAAQRQTLHWSPTFVSEMRAYLSVLILMGLHPFPDVNLYWSTDTFYRNPDISQTFTQKRFKKLTENIHLNDNTKEPARDTPDRDRLYKIRPMITKLNEVFQTQCSQSSTQSVD